MHDLIPRRFYSPAHRWYYDLILRPLLRRANAVIAVSEFTRTEVLAWSGIEPGRVKAIHNGVSAGFSCTVEPHRAGFEYLFYIGNRRPYKNVPRMLRGFAAASISRDVKFIVSGNPDREIEGLCKTLDLHDRVRFVGHIPEELLPGYYKGALATVYVSLREGFGLPVVESMAVGTPVLCSNAGALPEIAGGAALYVDSASIRAIAYGMERIVTDPATRAHCSSAGLRNAARFSWERCAQEHLETFRLAVGGVETPIPRIVERV